MGTRLAKGQALVDQLVEGGIDAYLDPDKASKNRPCVLVVPPRIDYTTGTTGSPELTWGLKVLSARGAGLEAWAVLDDLVDAVEAVLPIETADPIGYQLVPDTQPIPAYDLRLTT